MRFTSGGPRDIAIAALFGGILGWITVLQKWDSSPADLAPLYFAGYFFGAGNFDLVYVTQPNMFMSGSPEVWREMFDEIDFAGNLTYPYVYPPIWAALVSHITPYLEPITFFRIVNSLQILTIPVSIFLAWRIMEKTVPLSVVMIITFAFFRFTVFGLTVIKNGQPALLITFLVLLWFGVIMAGPVEARKP